MNYDPKNTIIINKFVHVPWLGQRYESTFMNRLNVKNKPINYNYKLYTQDNNNYNKDINLECFDDSYSCPKRVQILLLVLLVLFVLLVFLGVLS
jgi:hypothetical protein